MPCCRGCSASPWDPGKEGARIPRAAFGLWESLLPWPSDPSSKHSLHRALNGNHMAERGLSPSAVTLLSCSGNPSAFGEACSQQWAAPRRGPRGTGLERHRGQPGRPCWFRRRVEKPHAWPGCFGGRLWSGGCRHPPVGWEFPGGAPPNASLSLTSVPGGQAGR